MLQSLVGCINDVYHRSLLLLCFYYFYFCYYYHHTLCHYTALHNHFTITSTAATTIPHYRWYYLVLQFPFDLCLLQVLAENRTLNTLILDNTFKNTYKGDKVASALVSTVSCIASLQKLQISGGLGPVALPLFSQLKGMPRNNTNTLPSNTLLANAH